MQSLLIGCYCLIGVRGVVVDPGLGRSDPLFGFSDDLWDALAEWYRTQ